MLKSVLIVGAGSFVGGVLRYIVSMLMKSACGQSFPWGTLIVNLTGCFLFGVVFALFGRYNAAGSPWCLMLATGLCGGFTTFSAFVSESVQMLQNGNIVGFAGYVAASLVLGFLLLACGYWVVR